MTERLMYSERHAEYIKQTRKRTTNDTGNECQYTCKVSLLYLLFFIVNMPMIYGPTFPVLQVPCKNKSTTTHTTQFMVRTQEGYVLYLDT